jgi:hypothetical protein
MQNVALIAIVVGAILALVPFLEAIGMPIVRGSPSPEAMVRGGVLFVAGLVAFAWFGTMADPLGGRGPWDLFPWPYGVGLSLIVAAAVSAVFG